MFTIDIVLQDMPLPISVQRKEAEAAESLYQQILNAMRSGSSDLVELTCDKEEDKKVAVKGNLICAVSLNKKSGGMAEGRVPGFFAATTANK
ncbi:hypothetical protein I4641_22050 [Waterburya agarophytonicola K14]|uniref:Uncharacterized protein n=1 Tax=Waterburya agarophytonicola KI4 TaxID=2874699 RepID=A0A964BZS7_9CYAN|nr:hypothetical protein [Waterburya agarophytonicola]MCC0179641.1 hypothetical protein [Waterburya agarophytonicola KI4]